MPNGPLYALAGITADQILRLTLTNVARSPEANCLADISFVDETGMVRSHRRQTISPGLSQILDEPFSPRTTITSDRSAPTPADLAARVLLRPIIDFHPGDPVIPLSKACGAIKTTFSVNDATTAAATCHYSRRSDPPQEPPLR